MQSTGHPPTAYAGMIRCGCRVSSEVAVNIIFTADRNTQVLKFDITPVSSLKKQVVAAW